MPDSEFRIDASMTGFGVLTIRVAGDLDVDTSRQLNDTLGEWLGINELIIDLTECASIDSSGIGTLLACRYEIGSAAVMRLLGVAPSLEHTLRIAGLEAVLGLDPIA